jgi:hydrogenase expression/formation protein HypC
MEMDGPRANVDFMGNSRWIDLTLLCDVKVGDYVLVHAGFALQKVDPLEAEETRQLLSEIVGDPE